MTTDRTDDQRRDGSPVVFGSGGPAIDDRPVGPRRFREQRWLVDEIIRGNGIEWDQPRQGYALDSVGAGGAPEPVQARMRIRKLADITPILRSLAERRERLAAEALSADHRATASGHFFAAAILYALAAWPIFVTTPELVAVDDRKNASYSAWGRLCGHHVERVEIPFGDRTLPAWFHLPPDYDGTPVPTVLACGGMDGPKEMIVSQYGDRMLSRGFAVLAVDGPGQGEAPLHGVHVTDTNWIDAGEVLVRWLLDRPEVDDSRLVCHGVGFGSFWMTQIAATQPVFRGCAVGFPVFEPGARTLFEAASPTFKARHMWIAGLVHDEPAFDALVARYDLTPLMPEMTVPWLVVGGEADELSPIEHVYRLAALTSGPSSMVVYTGARHAMTESTAVLVGPPFLDLMADWLADRAEGRRVTEFSHLINHTGAVVQRPHPRLNTGV